MEVEKDEYLVAKGFNNPLIDTEEIIGIYCDFFDIQNPSGELLKLLIQVFAFAYYDDDMNIFIKYNNLYYKYGSHEELFQTILSDEL